MATKKSPEVLFLIVDPQNSFCHPIEGELYVKGAEKDMTRLAQLIDRLSSQIDAMYVTLDTHHELDVAHPIFWLNTHGEHPAPFTLISKQDVITGVWQPFDPHSPSPPFTTLQERMVEYVTKLEQNGRYQLTIWPPHCRIGTPGHNVYEPLREVLRRWELSQYKTIQYIMKGSNLFTEHYSVVQADVPDPNDPSTQLNIDLIHTLEQAKMLVFSGEASSHCVANTVRDIVQHFHQDAISKCILLKDAMSPVPGFESFAEDFFQEMTARGMKIITTADFSV
ncbi:amidase/nicotinamidase [Candidatus Vecturithrix granuli]|uniref:Amidase/nicotinamidase n=1 Tax=Vecturithrix granuli TaxID=1499967 RepID=A0A081C1Q8_VECG1|nr:amidase/nicotinamidase [Candidatus Vecturithrix granuli]